jgi:hypothetical protein
MTKTASSNSIFLSIVESRSIVCALRLACGDNYVPIQIIPATFVFFIINSIVFRMSELVEGIVVGSEPAC